MPETLRKLREERRTLRSRAVTVNAFRFRCFMVFVVGPDMCSGRDMQSKL